MSRYVLRLEVVNGPLKGQVAVVNDHESLAVGRLPECGLSIPQDLTVSRQHFRIEFHSPIGQLVHLSQTGETLVNGIPASTVELRNGDEITFGDGNKIRVIIEDSRLGSATATAVPVRAESIGTESNDRFTLKAASCGWHLYESASAKPDFAVLIEILLGSQKVHALVDLGRLGIPAPADIPELFYLFSWMEPPTRDQFSPVFMTISGDRVADIIRSGWGKDGIVCFGSKLSGSELMSHWRNAIGADGDRPGTSLTAYYWPSILNLILTCQSADQVSPLLGQLTWLFIEDQKSPGNWRLFAKDDFSPVLTKAGLVLSEVAAKS